MYSPNTAGGRRGTLILALALLVMFVLPAPFAAPVGDVGEQENIQDVSITRASSDPLWENAGKVEWRKDLTGASWGYTSPTSIADINGDGYLEVLVVSNSYGDVTSDGQKDTGSSALSVIDNNGNVIDSYSPDDITLRTDMPPLVADLDNDGKLEILVGGSSGGDSMWGFRKESALICLDSDMNTLWTYNTSSSWVNVCPAIGDLNGDGMLEIIYAASQEVLCIDHNGKLEWGMRSDQFWNIGYAPTIADLDLDGSPEILLVTWDGILCLDGDPSDGNDDGVADSEHMELHGYRRTKFDLLWYYQESIFDRWWWGDACAVADITGGPQLEIITGAENGALACLDYKGNLVWTSSVGGMSSTPVIGDVDNDGHNDIVALTYTWSSDLPNVNPDTEKDTNDAGTGSGGGADSSGGEGGSKSTGSRAESGNGDASTNSNETRPDPGERPPSQDIYQIICLDGKGETEWSYGTDWWGSDLVLCDLDMDRDLEVITTSADRILCLDGDEDSSGDISGNEILWEFASDSIYGWYNSFVVADIDLDSSMELVTISEDMVYSISAGGMSSTGGIEWGKEYYDLRNTNHYVHPMQSGVYIYPKDSFPTDDRILVTYAEAGEVVQYDLTVLNAGKYHTYYGSTEAEFSDTFVLFADNLPEGWSAVMSDRQVSLGPRESKDISVLVQVPYGAVSEEAARITLVAQAKLMPSVNDTQDTVTIVKGRYNVKLGCADSVHGDGVPSDDVELMGGDATVFRVTATNLGSHNDTVVLTTDVPYGFNTTLSVPRVSGEARIPLGAGESRDILMMVDIPLWATGGEYVINLTGTSTGDPEIYDTLSVRVRIMAALPGLFIRATPPSQEIVPNGTVIYNITIFNTLARELGVILNLSSPDTDNGWYAILDRLQLNVPAASSLQTNLEVGAPPDALADTLAVMDISALVPGEIMLRDRAKVYAHVVHVYGLDASLSQDVTSLMPRGVVRFTLDVRNTGNGFDHWSLFHDDIPGGFGVERSASPVTLDPLNTTSQEIVVNLSVPRTTLAGIYNISFKLVSEGGAVYFHNTTVEVLQYRGLTLEPSPSYQTSSAGRVITVILNLTNTGNGPESAHFSSTQSLSGVPVELLFDGPLEQFRTLNGFDPMELAATGGTHSWEEWAMVYEHAMVTLEPFSYLHVTAAVIVPVNAYLGPYTFTLSATSLASANVTAENTTRVEITAPDLTLYDLGEKLDGLSGGDTGVVKVEIADLGNAPAYNVTVSLYIDDDTTPVDSGSFAVVSGNITAVMKWVVRGDEKSVRIVVDPDNTIDEVDESNNDLELPVSAREPSGGYEAAAGWAMWSALLLAFLLILLVLVYIGMTRRKG